MICDFCGGPMKYMGIVDGCGDYGDQTCEEWECLDCGNIEDHGHRGGTSWEQLTVDELLSEEEPEFDDDDTKDFPF